VLALGDVVALPSDVTNKRGGFTPQSDHFFFSVYEQINNADIKRHIQPSCLTHTSHTRSHSLKASKLTCRLFKALELLG